ncbi:hypothetical protein JO972_16190 [Verrucomicrobiaceae bacterium 5K15]|uniref:Glycosyl transferase family 1 domain-containing protein n=1 Tax=Oceaniferula flava TaxID=2800421 RepID=A0AAE2SH79_9BACT|nr:glycosyltransferase [Oceaniferula flavus]MBK1856510.1 hypothetical protein [Oceaniferula flavus]MBM1137817.1 hypothetical protein [Oceaniferula flavus]
MCKIRIYPESKDNPYVENFFQVAYDKGFCVTGNSIFELIFSTDILHIQWPEAWRWEKKPKRLMMAGYFLFLPLLKFLFQIKVINTVHNLKPHSKQSNFAHWLYVRTLKQSEGFVHLTDSGKKEFLIEHPWASNRKHATIPHPDYARQLSSLNRDEARKKLGLSQSETRIAYFGYIKPYKGVDRLIETFLKLKISPESASLWVGGNTSEGMKKTLIDLTCDSSNIQLQLEYVAEDELETQVKAADWVVLPYFSGLNSGAAVYALSCGSRAVVPDTSVMRELDKLTGGGSFKYFRQADFTKVLSSVFTWSGGLSSTELNLDALGHQRIGKLYLDFVNLVTGRNQ